MGARLKSVLKALLKIGISVAALVIVFRKIDIQEVWKLYQASNLWLVLLALVFFVASKAVSAVRLNLYFKAAGLHLPDAENMKLYLLGMFYNLFLPGGISGDGYKVWWLQKQYKTGTAKLIGAVLVDRVSGVAALFVLGIALFPFMKVEIPYEYWILGAVPLVFLSLYLFQRWFYRYFVPVYGITTAYAFAVQGLQVVSAWFLFKGLGGNGPGLEYLLLFLVSSVVAIIPFTIGGAGARELTFLYGANLLDADMNLAVGISFLFYLITVLVSFTGLYYMIRGDRIRVA